MELPFKIESYCDADTKWWPSEGKHILASFTEDSVIVFQAYNHEIAEWVVKHQSLCNCPGFSLTRMTWIKPNFLWMMFRSGWATKVNQERILAISVTHEGFKELLSRSKRNGNDSSEDDVRLQWDPDHDPYGEKVTRRAIQLGVRGATLKTYLEEWIISISDITDFVKEQYTFVQRNELQLLKVPVQRVYQPTKELQVHLGLDEIVIDASK